MFFLSFLLSFFSFGHTLTSKPNTGRTAGIGVKDSRGTITFSRKWNIAQQVSPYTWVKLCERFQMFDVCIGASSIPASDSTYWCL